MLIEWSSATIWEPWCTLPLIAQHLDQFNCLILRTVITVNLINRLKHFDATVARLTFRVLLANFTAVKSHRMKGRNACSLLTEQQLQYTSNEVVIDQVNIKLFLFLISQMLSVENLDLHKKAFGIWYNFFSKYSDKK
jgi:hypothetical protein